VHSYEYEESDEESSSDSDDDDESPRLDADYFHDEGQWIDNDLVMT